MNLTTEQKDWLIAVLKNRFEQNMHRHTGFDWAKIQEKIEKNPEKLTSLYLMEETGGEPDVLDYKVDTDVYLFFDCATESPKNRRSLCYDNEALEKRKEHKPANNVLDVAKEIGIKLLNEQEYRFLQTFGTFDTKTSSWIETPEKIRKLGGALFADFRYQTIFIYHNGAESYYAARGFRGFLEV